MTPIQSKALALVAVSAIEAKSAIEERKRDELRSSMISDAETETLVRQFVRARNLRPFTEAEASEMLSEVISIREMHCCVELALQGLIDIDIDLTRPVHERMFFKPRLDIHNDLRDVLRRREEDGK